LSLPWALGLLVNPGAADILRSLRRKPLELLDALGNSPTQVLDGFIDQVLRTTSRGKRAERSIARQFATRLYPWDPLVKDDPEAIDVFIFTHPKDIDILPYAVLGAQRSIRNSICSFNVVGPEAVRQSVFEVSARLHLEITFFSDEEILRPLIGELDFQMARVPRMEFLKIACSLSSNQGLALVIDGDTVLLRERTWASKSYRIALVAQEYLKAHIAFNETVLTNVTHKHLGFVTHHQLVETSIISNFLCEFGGPIALAQTFQDAFIDFEEVHHSFPSEWQLIGELNMQSPQRNYVLARFGNYGISRRELGVQFHQQATYQEVRSTLELLANKAQGLGSLSLHDYKT
jgi:hypothetical protein